MNLNELMETVVPIQVRLPDFKDSDDILKIVEKAIEVDLYYLEAWCSKCNNWKMRVKSDSYPWYSTHDCECVIQNNYINTALSHLKNIDRRELLKYNYSSYIWNQPWKEYLFNMLDKDKKWYYIYWPPWNWKTYSAYIILQMYSINNTVFTSSLQAVLEDSRPPNEWYLYKKCEFVDVLMLDDFGREKMSEWVENKLFDLLNNRDKKNLVTIFTSNRNIWEGLIFSDKAIQSRFLWNCNTLNLTGKDLRV